MSLAEIYRNLALGSFALSAILFFICIFLLTKGGAYKTIKGLLYKKNILKIDVQEEEYDFDNDVLEDEVGILQKNRDPSESTALMSQKKENIQDQDHADSQDETLPLYEYDESDETLPLEDAVKDSADEEQTAMLYDDGTDETMPLSFNIREDSKKKEKRNDQKKEAVRYENGTKILEHKIFCESKEI